LVKRASGFTAFDEANGLANPAAQIVVHYQAGILAQAGRRFGASLEVFAREWADNQPARADEGRDRSAERYAANDSA
jgi:hypothetical protein